MIQITPQMRIVGAIDAQDFRKGIDGLARVCRDVLAVDPFSGWIVVFRNRRQTALRILCYDGQGFWRHTSGSRKAASAGGRRVARPRRRSRRISCNA